MANIPEKERTVEGESGSVYRVGTAPDDDLGQRDAIVVEDAPPVTEAGE